MVSSEISNSESDEVAIKNFRDYIRIPSVHPNVDYTPCIEFLKRQADSMGLQFRTFSFYTGKPIAVITVNGADPTASSILLNSHMDVVPVFEDKWTVKPFDAYMDDQGNIYGRGTQDMKCVGIQYLEVVRRLQKNKIQLKRTLHISFVPDEEIGGHHGMALFVKSNEFKELNVGFALDEGVASPTSTFLIFHGERSIWQLQIHCPGQPGHGSLLLENTAGEKINYILEKFYEFRNQESQKLKNNPELTIGDVTTVNLTQMKGGVQPNVVPVEFVVIIDCRIPVTVDIVKWEETLNRWCKEAGEGVCIQYINKAPQIPVTKLDDSNNFWLAFKAATDEMKLDIKKEVFPGGTDSRYVREMGIPVIGFSPMNNTPILLHDNDEFLNSEVFLRGIDIYFKIIQSIASS